MRSTYILVGLFATFTLGCDGSIGAQPPCESATPPPQCEVACTGDSECELGFYCNTTSGMCTAECTPGGGQCGADATCDDRGRCIPDVGGTPDGGSGCPGVAVSLSPVIPTVILLIDQSGSMDDDFNGTSRWAALRSALVTSGGGIIDRLQASVVFGAVLYTSDGGFEGGECPMLQQTPAQLNNYEAINSLLRDNGPAGDTPTAESVNAVISVFPTPDPERPAPRILVLATDGNPDNCEDSNAHDLGSQAMSEAAVQNVFGAGIETIVLSVGDDVAEPHLQRLANAGQGVSLDSGSEPYYVATDPDELVDAFNTIIRGARTCEFTVNGSVDLAEACNGTVTLNGTPLMCGEDWHMIDESTMELLDSACDTWLDNDNVLLTADFPCGVVVL